MEETTTNEPEVPTEDQAVMAVKLHDNVRDLIREELKKALSDPTYVSELPLYNLATPIANAMGYNDSFKAHIRTIIKNAL